MENWLGLTTVSGLFAVVTALPLGEERCLDNLPIRICIEFLKASAEAGPIGVVEAGEPFQLCTE